MRELIEFIYDIFSGWFQQKHFNESQWSRIIRGFIGVLLITLSISIVIYCIYLFAKLKYAA